MGDGRLDEIGIRHGTDKSSTHHDYLGFYEMFFSPMRGRKLKILEVGILDGASLRTWHEYFPEAEIVGADIRLETLIHAQDRISVEIVDQSNIEDLVRVAHEHGPFDIIVEDGSHMWEHQITSLRTLFPFVKNGGIYIAEDLQTNYGDAVANYKGVASESCVEYLKRWLDLTVADSQIDISEVEDAFLRTYGRAADHISFYRRACLVRKRIRPKEISASVGTPIMADDASAPSLPVRVLAHVSYIGNVYGEDGYVNASDDRNTIQSIAIKSVPSMLRYSVRWDDGSWTDFSQFGETMGTAGQARPLTGIRVKLQEAFEGKYALRVAARFAGSRGDVVARDGEDCIGEGLAPMVGLHVILSAI